ncbi:MAG: phosphoribosylaminoimidazolesuccinocarboxamide synthase [Candidatus Omnitrophota bacterium]|nr:phosphoribosylaminoimidazolesuccinocarboxamide synthase [Candidatus Omnitrophota bacterium]
MESNCLLTTDFKDLKLFRRGKVRDVYDLGEELLIISTDRISCFDVVLPSGIPYKGRVLTALSCFWFDFLKEVIEQHVITADASQYPKVVQKYANVISGRSMLVKKSKPLPVECVVRGYLSGSGWKEYKTKQSICEIKLPAGLKESDQLPQVIFTPSTKEEVGHDQNVSQDYVKKVLGTDIFDKIMQASISLYQKAAGFARQRGIIIADTKFEFGILDKKVILIDEVLTPDSSRFWPADQYQPGKQQPSFDKQFVRDYLEGLDWDKTPPGPVLPQDIINKTTEKYLDAYFKLTGKKLIE